MDWEKLREELNLAIDESELIGIELAPLGRGVGLTLSVLSLPVEGPPPEDRRVQVLLFPVGRVAASLRDGRFDDEDAVSIPFAAENLLPVVQGLGGQPIYGRRFFDDHEAQLARWGHRLSLDWYSGTNEGMSKTVHLFQYVNQEPARSLDICIWFDQIQFRRPDWTIIPTDQFVADGRRWWDGLHARDPRTDGMGIFLGNPFETQ